MYVAYIFDKPIQIFSNKLSQTSILLFSDTNRQWVVLMTTRIADGWKAVFQK